SVLSEFNGLRRHFRLIFPAFGRRTPVAPAFSPWSYGDTGDTCSCAVLRLRVPSAFRHGRACPGQARTSSDKPGHDAAPRAKLAKPTSDPAKRFSHISEKQHYQNPVRLVNKLSIFPYRAPWSLT